MQTTEQIPSYQTVIDRLRRVRRRDSLAVAIRNTAIIAGLYVIVLLAAAAVEHFFRIGSAGRTILYWLLNGAAGAAVLTAVFPHLLVAAGIRRGGTDFASAHRVGRAIPSIRDRLLNALQVVSSEDRGYSPALTEAAFADVVKDLDGADLDRLTDFRVPGVTILAAAGACLLAGSILLFSGDGLSAALNRVWSYDTEYEIPSAFRLILEPGNTEVVQGTAVTMILRVEGTVEEPPRLLGRPEHQERFETLELRQAGEREFRHELTMPSHSVAYYARSGEAETDRYLLTVLDPPMIRTMRLMITPPRYSGLAPREQDDHHGDVTGLPGTAVQFRIGSSKELAKAELVFDDSSRMSLDVTGERATGLLRLSRSMGYRVRLEDRNGLPNRDPVSYSLKVVPDELPRVAIEVPGTDIAVAGNEELGLRIRVIDDYGISRARLAYRLIASRYEQPSTEDTFVDITLPGGFGTGGTLLHPWKLGDLSLVPEDVIAYYVEVYDNDNVSGPKRTASETYHLRLPSLEEVFAQVDEEHDRGLEMLDDALREAEELKREMADLQEDLRKKQQQADWQEQRRAEELGERYKELQKSLKETADRAEQMINEMQKNNLLSPETLQKYQELQELLAALNSPELEEALQRLQESLRRPDPEEMLAAMENLRMNEEHFRKSIERTMNLLKRIQIEQKMDEAIRRMEEMLARQEEVNKATEEAEQAGDPKELENPAREQNDLSRRMEQMDPLLEQLESMMREFPSEMPVEMMQQTNASFDSSAIAEEMERLAEQLRNMELQEAMSGQQQVTSAMQQMMNQMMQMQQMMRMNQQQEIVNEMRGVYQDLLELSKRQEQMKNETGELDRNSPLFREGLNEQMEALQSLGRVTDRLSAVAQKTFGVTPEMGESIGEAMARMSAAMEALAERNGQSAARMQAGAMESLNEAASQVQSAMQAMMQGGGEGMAMAGLMQRLQGMSATQQGINQGTRHLGSMDQQQAAEMARLAGEQGRVRKSLEQLAREAARAGELSKLLGDLDRAAREMREVQTDLAQGSVRPETLRKQERILSRLLDSQRSLQERDYEQKRTAEAAKGYERQQTPETDLSAIRDRERLRSDLLRALEQGYSTDYQSMIRTYFELLQKMEAPE